jgi:hypothetical protein
MSTREDMRRELRDVAKLASVLARDSETGTASHASDPQSASRVTVPPVSRSIPPLSMTRRPAQIRPTPLLPIPRTPPRRPRQALSLPPPIPEATANPPAAPQPAGLRGGWAVLAGAITAAAMVGGLLLGEVLTSRSSAAAARTTDLPAAAAAARATDVGPQPSPGDGQQAPSPGSGAMAAAPAAGMQAAADGRAFPSGATLVATAPPAEAAALVPTDLDAIPTTSPSDLPQANGPMPPMITGACPPTTPPRAARPFRRGAAANARAGGFPGANGGPAYAAAPPAPVKTPIATKGPTSRGRDSLDDLIRKAAGGS